MAEGLYDFSVSALDAAGNASLSSEVMQVNISVASNPDEADNPWGGHVDPVTGGESVSVDALLFTLDVDQDGQVTPFSDGLMVIRKLLGDAFKGDALTQKAVSNNAGLSTDSIHAFIEKGIESGSLDVDGDGVVTAFSDGLMIVRYMLGSGFIGPALVDKALGHESPFLEHDHPWEPVVENISALMNH